MAIVTRASDGETMSDINTTPLIDVMLVLLTLLIITLPMQTDAVKLDLPRHAPPPQVPPPVVTLAVDFDGSAVWNGARVDRATLDRHLAAAARRSPQPDIHVEPNRLAKYDAVALVLADAARAGATHIGFSRTRDFAP